MKTSVLALMALTTVLTAGLSGCPVGDTGSEGEGEGEGEGEVDRCAAGCVETIAAACDNGPPSQAECEADCEALRAGACSETYEVLLQCDGTVACDAGGIPTVQGCEDEQTAFRSCLNG